ncbi:MAG: glycerophosphodiester phosphodiesterase, partial [Oscillospiraceae bacterium]|nr:glycerophosphodiester phosphodiesterase [Oscillospiraceae bacterium]
KLFAHRGLHGDGIPENSLAAFDLARRSGYGVELDVQLTADKKVVVFHDEEVSRTTGAKGWVKDMTLAEMRELDPSNGFDIHDQKVPTLDEYFSLVEDKDLVTFVELKNSFITYPGMEEKVLECIDRHDLRKKVIVYSANHYSVMKFKEMAPDVEICFPFDNWIFDYGEYCEKRNVTITIPYHFALTQEIMDDFHKHGVKVYPWTVDEPEEMRRMLDMGADGMLTNRVDLLTELYK